MIDVKVSYIFYMYRLVQVVFRHGDRSPLVNPFFNTKLGDITEKYWQSEVIVIF